MSAKTIKEACDALIQTLNNYFNVPRDNKWRLRMSNIGKPACQLYFEKMGTPKIPLNPQDIIKFATGDLVEILVKAILKETFGEGYEDSKRVSIQVGDYEIKGTTDVSINGDVEDVKTSSDWAYKNKWASSATVVKGDTFGYVNQLLGYSKGGAGEVGGWYVVNKSTGEMTYVELELTDEEKEQAWKELEAKVQNLMQDEPVFEREFEDEPETFYKKETGNRVLNPVCKFCPYRETCWPGLQELPKIPSKASNPAIEYYTYVADKKETEDE